MSIYKENTVNNLLMNYDFSYHNKFAAAGTALSIDRFIPHGKPLILCIGTPRVSGDSLGPIVGSLLKYYMPEAEIFGTTDLPLTAKEVPFLTEFISKTFIGRRIITVDSAVGNSDEVGIVRISDVPLRPASALKKNFSKIGEVNIQGIVCERNILSVQSLREVSSALVYSMAHVISEGIKQFIVSRETNDDLLTKTV